MRSNPIQGDVVVDRLLDYRDAKNPLRRRARLSAAGCRQNIDEATRRSLSPVAIRACARLASHWKLEDEEIAALLAMTPAEYQAAVASSACAVLEPEQFDRAGILVEMFVALQIFRGGLANRWPRLPNDGPLFGGRSPVELMQAGGIETMEHVLALIQGFALGLFS